MKDKIVTLIIGILLGAIITAMCFILIGNNARKDMPNGDRMDKDGKRMENMIPGGRRGQDGDIAPNDNNSSQNNNEDNV